MTTVFALETPLGRAWAEFDQSDLVHLTLREIANAAPPDSRANDLQNQLDGYFAGTRQQFEISLRPKGTDFQQRVWHELGQIPYGSTCSYGLIAQRLGDIKATRAVGLANGQNPIWILIPCHRVIGANGHLTGYAGGLDVKAKLLEVEGLRTPDLFAEEPN
ncbi:MAG: methylated-DNA--[protein]-cysteine S-methyltransferase [Fimbriimonas sp.]